MNILSNVAAGDFRNCVSPVPLRHFYAISAWGCVGKSEFICFDFIRKHLSYQALSAFVRLRRVSETGSLSPIPNFICTHSPSIFLDFQGVSAFSVLAVTPFLHHFRIWLYWISSDYTMLPKLLDGIIQRFGSHMNIAIHRRFDAGVTKQLLQHFGLYTAFDCMRCIGMSQGVHTEFFNSCFVAELVKVGINCIPSTLAKKDALLQINYSI